MIGDDCLLGMNSACGEGVRLGDNVTVAPFTWVRRSVPSGSLVAGVPARITRVQPFAAAGDDASGGAWSVETDSGSR